MNLVLPVTPRRRRGREFLDDATQLEAGVVERSLGDVARANTLFGGTRAVVSEVRRAVRDAPARTITLLDVGTGLGDIPASALVWCRRHGIHVEAYGVEPAAVLASAARKAGLTVVRADARGLPFADRSVDIVMCSQVLHHFDRPSSIALIRELDRVAQHRVIVSDLRRNWLAVAGIWLASFPLRFHPVSRHDGVMSVLRGFTRRELRELVRTAVGRAPETRNQLGFRTTASWTPGAPPS
ncbi:MAG TPA: methyltransferase domain-containing protein [Gemmatimonadaceae bacterium]